MWKILVSLLLLTSCTCQVPMLPESNGFSTQPSDTVGCKQFRDEQIGCKLVYPDT